MHTDPENDYNVESEESQNSNEKEKENSKKAIDLDTILVREIGQFGIYQFRSLLLVYVLVIFAAWAASEFVFTTGRISTRCLIPECDSDIPQWSPSWIEIAIPPASSGSGLDNCRRYAPSNVTAPGTCPAELFDQDQTINCDEYMYENTNTVVYDFELACNEWQRTLIGTIRIFGTFTALPITGYISDNWGRRTALTINAFNTAWLGLVRYWAKTYVGFLISEVAEATFGSGGFSSSYILVMEMMGPKYRVAASASMQMLFSVGQVLMALIAWAVPNWRTLTLVLYVPQLITVFYYFFLFESVRWYMSKGRYEESEYVLKEVAKINKKEISEKSLQALRQNAKETKKKNEEEKLKSASEPWLIVLVFRNKPILTRCLVAPVWWITTTFTFHGMTINSVNMSGNPYLNYMAVSAVEIPGYWMGVYLMTKIGRKPALIGAFWICAACQFGYVFMPESLYWLSLTLYLIGNFSIAMVASALYVYTAELYPTRYRHSLFAYCSMVGRIGNMLAPQTPLLASAVWVGLPNAVFGGLGVLSGILVFITPETRNSKLPDTMEEACRIGKEDIKK